MHECRAAAIQAGAVPALCNILVQGETGAPPVALGDVLKALYAIIATDAGSGAGTSELFASGGIHSLVGCSFHLATGLHDVHQNRCRPTSGLSSHEARDLSCTSAV